MQARLFEHASRVRLSIEVLRSATARLPGFNKGHTFIGAPAEQQRPDLPALLDLGMITKANSSVGNFAYRWHFIGQESLP